MRSAFREMQQKLKNIDTVCEIRDARVSWKIVEFC